VVRVMSHKRRSFSIENRLALTYFCLRGKRANSRNFGKR
jgi:hypothetical protein